MANAVPLPIGTVIPTFIPVHDKPANWLVCDGSEIPETYKDLRSLLGSKFTPNLIGRTLVGFGPTAKAQTTQSDGKNPNFAVLGADVALGNTGGECSHKLTVEEIPSHTHAINNGNFGLHYRSFAGDNDDDIPFETNSNTRLGGTDATGGSNGHFNIQPYCAVVYYICAA